jgi:DNA gyrase subunit A
MANFGLSQIQAQAILDMQLHRLTGLERQKILDELAELLKLIERLLAILSSEPLLLRIIIEDLRRIQQEYGDDRRTEILAEEGEFRVEDLIAEEDMAITVSNTGYIKRTAVTNYRNQRRGGKGRIGMRTREEDFVSHLFIASTHAYIMIFSDRGRAYWLKVHEIPDVGPDSRGKAIANLVSMEAGERIAALLTVKEFEPDKFIVMGTQRGVIKKTELSAFSNPRAGGIIAIGVEEGDAVISVSISDGSSQIFIATRSGKSIRFNESDVRSMGRTAYGVRGISLRADDDVVAMEVLGPIGTILTVTEQGYGKRTGLDEYRVQSRGGSGIINIQTSDRNGKVIGVIQVSDDDELMLITIQGKILRMASKDIRTIGRSTQGVRLIDIEGEDRAVSSARRAEGDDGGKDIDSGDDTAATGAATATVEGQEQAIAELLKRADAAEDADEGAGTEGETAAGNEDDDKDGAE